MFNKRKKLNKNKTIFYIQKKFFNTNSLFYKKKVLGYISTVLEDDKRFSAYFQKRFPMSFKYLPIVQFIVLLLMFLTVLMDNETYKVFLSSMLAGESPPVSSVSYSRYTFGCFFVILVYEFVLSIYVIFKANHPLKYKFFKVGQKVLKIAGASSVMAVGYSQIPVKATDSITNFVHTKTPFGRGYDYEIGSYDVVVKGDMISSFLGPEDMVRAVEKHAPDSHIIDINKLSNIINDPEFKSKIRKNTTFAEKAALGIPLFDISSST